LLHQTGKIERRCIGEAFTLTQELQGTQLTPHAWVATTVEDEVARLTDLTTRCLLRPTDVGHAVIESICNTTSIVRVCNVSWRTGIAKVFDPAMNAGLDVAKLTLVGVSVEEVPRVAFLASRSVEAFRTVLTALGGTGLAVGVQVVPRNA
jgi:hypothetical protein